MSDLGSNLPINSIRGIATTLWLMGTMNGTNIATFPQSCVLIYFDVTYPM